MTDIDPAVYRKAAAVIRKGGLVKGAFSTGYGYCTLGAIGYNHTAMQEGTARATVLADLIGNVHQENPAKVISAWNDAEERTPDDVITLLEQAAEKLEANR